MKKNYLILLFFFSLMTSVVAQTTLTGKITDGGTGEEMIGTYIIVTRDGNFYHEDEADIDGNFSIRVYPGVYDIEFRYVGYQTQKITGVQAIEGNATKINVQLKEWRITEYVIHWNWKIPLITQDDNTQGIIITSEQIKKQPTRNIREMSILAPGVSFNQ